MTEHLMTYKQLIDSLDDRKPTYQELLNTQEWKNFRKAILLKDQEKCTVCGTKKSEKIGKTNVRDFTPEEIKQQKILDEIEYKLREPDFIFDGKEIKLKPATKVGEILNKPLYLHAHHNFYVFGDLPWEYDVLDLKTMCENCHTKFHEENIVPFYSDSSRITSLSLTPCARCSGTGFLPEYTHQGGICFKCRGAKYEELIGTGIY